MATHSNILAWEIPGTERVSGVAKSQTWHFSRDSTHHYLSLLLPCLFIFKKPWKSHSVLKLLPWVFGNVSPAILLPGENHKRVGALTKPWCPAPSASSGQPSKFHYALTSVLSLKSCPECPLKLWPACPDLPPHHFSLTISFSVSFNFHFSHFILSQRYLQRRPLLKVLLHNVHKLQFLLFSPSVDGEGTLPPKSKLHTFSSLALETSIMCHLSSQICRTALIFLSVKMIKASRFKAKKY